jgi:hypothetical protein
MSYTHPKLYSLLYLGDIARYLTNPTIPKKIPQHTTAVNTSEKSGDKITK